MSKVINGKIILRNDTKSAWLSANPTLAKGEVALELDTHLIKIGDGVTAYADLPYAGYSKLTQFLNDGNFVQDANYNTLKATVNSLDSKVKELTTAGGEPNTIDTVKVNGTALTPDGDKAVDVTIKSGKTNGTLAVNGVDIGVTGLGSAAYTASSAYDTAGSAQKVLGSSTDAKDANTVYGLKKLVTENNTSADTRIKSLENTISGKADKATTLAGYGITDAMTASDINTAIAQAAAQVLRYKGNKDTVADLPTSGNNIGDTYFVTERSTEYAWQGEKWEELGATYDFSAYLTGFSIAGISVSASAKTVSAAQMQSALGLGSAAYKNVDTSIAAASKSANVPTSSAVASFVEGKDYATNTTVTAVSNRVATLEAIKPTKVEASSTNGNIKIDGKETAVYRLPATTIDSSDVLIVNCGNSTTNY